MNIEVFVFEKIKTDTMFCVLQFVLCFSVYLIEYVFVFCWEATFSSNAGFLFHVV